VQRPVVRNHLRWYRHLPRNTYLKRPVSAKALRRNPGISHASPRARAGMIRPRLPGMLFSARPCLPASITSRSGRRDLRAGSPPTGRIGFELDERGVARNDGDRLELVTLRRPAVDRTRQRRPRRGFKSGAGAGKRRLHRARPEKQRPAAGPASQRRAAHRARLHRGQGRRMVGRPVRSPPRRAGAQAGRGTVIHADMAIFQFGRPPSASRNPRTRRRRRRPARAAGNRPDPLTRTELDAAGMDGDHGGPPARGGIQHREQAMPLAPGLAGIVRGCYGSGERRRRRRGPAGCARPRAGRAELEYRHVGVDDGAALQLGRRHARRRAYRAADHATSLTAM